MTQASSITPEEVVAAFGRSSQFPEGSPGYELHAPFVGQFIEVIGVDYLDDPVCYSSICSASIRCLKWLFDNEDFTSQPGVVDTELYQTHETVIAALELMSLMPEFFLAMEGRTEEDAMLSEEMGLGADAQALYRDGELTFGALLKLNPEVFIT